MRRSVALLGAAAAAAVLACPAACRAQATPAAAPAPALADAGAPFGRLPLVEEIDCAATPPADPEGYREEPAGGSRVETLLGRACRVLPNEGDARFFAYRVGRGKGLVPGRAYVLAVEFPDDRPRSVFVRNDGAETIRGFSTGAALGDVLFTYTNNNAESLKLPQTGKYQTWRSLFFLHDRFPGLSLPRNSDPRTGKPEDGFWVVIAQSKAENDPISAGAAVARIRLYAVPDPEKLAPKVTPPPAGLPRRHLFWREEMGDSFVGARKPEERGVTRDADWFAQKAQLARFLGMDTLGKDLLEFGHNQGWDAGPNDDWYVNPPFKGRWEELLGVAARYHMAVMPYYEYAGSVGKKEGVGARRSVLPLKGTLPYTHIEWSERFYADVTDPDTLKDATRLLDATITRYKARATFVGAWFRPRPSHMPISFADAALARFAAQANNGKAVTREELRADKALLGRYYDWWFGKRRDFVAALAAHLREKVSPDAVVLLTPDSSEPGRSLPAPMRVVTDDPDGWKALLGEPKQGKPLVRPTPYAEVAGTGAYLDVLTSPPGTWGEWEWQHSIPQADPARWHDQHGAMLTYTLNRAYTAASPAAFDAFRGPDGLAVAYHYPLNENAMHPALGYFVADVERAGPYVMLAEARAMANGDPRLIGYLASNSFNRGFPEYARAFNAAFLSLPALPSRVLPGASGADPAVVVRAIDAGKHGTYLAVVNTGLAAKKGVAVRLPAGAGAAVVDAPTGAALRSAGGALRLDLGPCEMRALRILPPAAPKAATTGRTRRAVPGARPDVR